MSKKFVLVPVLALFALFGAHSASAAGPALMVGINPMVVTQNGTAATPNVTFANIRLSAASSTEDMFVSSLPVSITAANGGSTSNLTNCRAVNTSNGMTLNTGANSRSSVLSGTNTFMFDSPIRIAAGNYVDVAVRCDILASNAVNNTYAFNLNPLSVAATSAVSGAGVATSIGMGVPTAPISVTTTGTTGVIIPGLPNTGMGGSASTNIALLALAGMVTAAGVVFSRRFAR